MYLGFGALPAQGSTVAWLCLGYFPPRLIMTCSPCQGDAAGPCLEAWGQ